MHVLRLQGTKTVWTVHNLRSHEQKHPRLESLFMQCFVRSLDGAHFLSPSSKEAGIEQFPALAGRPHAVVPHGHYRTAYPDTVSRGAARDRLDLPREAQVLSFVGKIRPYKNVPTLIQTFRQCQGDALRLLVAGQPRTSTLEDELRTAARRDEERVRLFLDFLPDEDLQLYLKAADLIVLPFERILNSGSALLGLSFDRPILVPHIGSMPDLQERIGDQWVRTYSPPLTVGTLREALEWARHPPRAERAPLNSLNWDRVAAATADFFERLCSQKRSRTVA
jgi:glycosyltransferase involved in cell wall biosynthesis